MYDRTKAKAAVRFVIRPQNGARSAALAGDFNGWTPSPMQRQKDGTFAKTVSGLKGIFEYKFVVDGQWVRDPDNSHWAPDSYGGFNSVGRAD